LATIHNVTDDLDRQTDRQNIKFSMNVVVYAIKTGRSEIE